MMKIINVVGARPNFMKVAPVHAEMRRRGLHAILVHTGQHYDHAMSKVFFDALDMPYPDIDLGVGSGSHAIQTARVMEGFEPIVVREKPDMVMVAGDVNSTVACALVAVKLGVRVAHLEAGLRSFDEAMPEEINRILTDRMSHALLTPSPDADDNLRAEGVSQIRIHRVGNAMIDSLLAHLDRARATAIVARMGLEARGYALLTIHRPSNVDDPSTLRGIVDAVLEVSSHLPVVFPLHPRTRARLEEFSLMPLLSAGGPRLIVTEPMGYLEFLALEADAAMVLTDSGGIQEETTALGVPCLTLRDNTERPITITAGTNELIGSDRMAIVEHALRVLGSGGKRGKVPDLWDGRTAERAVDVIAG